MSRIQPAAVVPAASQPMLEAVQKKMGMVPNMMKTLANAPSVLESYLNFSGAVAKSSLTAAQRESIALAVGQINECGYCLSAHTLLGKHAGLNAQQTVEARHARAAVPVDHAILTLAKQVVTQQGRVSDGELQAARTAGLNDAQILEVVAVTVLNILTNYLNHVADPQIDFPVVSVAI